MSKVKVNARIDIRKVSNANVVINETGFERSASLQFVKIADGYAISNEGVVFQILSQKEDCGTLAYYSEDEKCYYNYAEDEIDNGDLEDWLRYLEPEFEELTEADMDDFEDDYALKAKCDAYDDDEVSESRHAFLNVIADFGTNAYFGNLCWFCGMNKRFKDLGTRFNDYDNSPDYTPYAVYYFF